jgi:hypothetical protein
MKFSKAFVCVFCFLIPPSLSLFRKVVPILSEEYENCATPEEDYGVADFSEYELIAVNDYEVFINGSVKILRDIESPLPVHVFAERFERGQWIVMYYDTKRADFCKSMKDSSEIWYDIMKDMKGCPLKAGVRKQQTFDDIST